MKKIIRYLLIGFALSTFLFSGADCAVIDEAAPYSGEYVFLYNSGEFSVNIENLPVPSGLSQSSETERIMPENISGSVNIDGEVLYIEEMTFPDTEDAPVMLLSLDDDYRQFSGADSYTNSSYSFFANKRFESDTVKVYVEEGSVSNVSEENAVATDIGNKFEDILTYINENFASYKGQTTVLIHNIKDANYYGKSSSFVAGYFSTSEYLEERIVHIDLYPLMARASSYPLNPSNAYKTLAHEFTHLVEHSVNNENTNVDDMWFSEMFALSSEAGIFKDDADSSRIFDLVRDYNGVVRGGAIVNYSEYADNSSDVSANYGLLYAFTSYIKTQFGDDVFKNILESSVLAENSENALLDGIKKSSGNEITFEELLENFYISLIVTEENGTYKLMNTNYSHLLNMPLKMSGNVTLKPKAAVVVPLFNEEFDASAFGENIKYTVFSKDGAQQMEKIEIGNDKKVVTTINNLIPVVFPIIDGQSILFYDMDLFDKIMFIPEDESKVFFTADGYTLGFEKTIMKVRCQSIVNKDAYDVFEITITDTPVCINYILNPEYDEEKNGVSVVVYITNTLFEELKTLDVYFAVFEENGKLVVCEKKEKIMNYGAETYGRGIQFEGLDKNKKYILKMFIFKPDGSLYPLSREYVTKYNM